MPKPEPDWRYTPGRRVYLYAKVEEFLSVTDALNYASMEAFEQGFKDWLWGIHGNTDNERGRKETPSSLEQGQEGEGVVAGPTGESEGNPRCE